MPSFQRQVGFSRQVTVSRQPKDKERAAIHNFAVHSSHCDYCHDPYSTHLSGGTLCERGHEYAYQVARYVCNRDDKSCSTKDFVDHEPVRIEIPAGYESVKGLLKAMERGFRIHKAARAEPVVSYDRTYPVAPRPVSRSGSSKRKSSSSHRRVDVPAAPTPYPRERITYFSSPYETAAPPVSYEQPELVYYASPPTHYEPTFHTPVYYPTQFYR